MSFVQDPENFFVIADYLFVTSYHESLNYSILEALATKNSLSVMTLKVCQKLLKQS
jgi:hypothetical protein